MRVLDYSATDRSILRILTVIFVALMVACGGGGNDGTQPSQPIITGSRTLAIPPIYQQSEVWCWAASAEMIFRAYGLPNLNPAGNFQCGIVGAYYGPNHPCYSNCNLCQSGIGTMSQMKVLIDQYGLFSNNFTRSPVLSSRISLSALTFNNTASEINSGRPILAGISPNGYSYPNISEHVVVIVGYVINNQGQTLVVNDPFPYEAFPLLRNPYTSNGGILMQLGRYSISYSAFVSQMRWGNTLDQIR